MAKPIVFDGKFGDYARVQPEYRDFQGDTLHRDHFGWNKSIRYTNTTGRNDIIRTHVSPTQDTVAFHVSCSADISPGTDPRWMRLFIDADQNSKSGWNGYDLLVNRTDRRRAIRAPDQEWKIRGARTGPILRHRQGPRNRPATFSVRRGSLSALRFQMG